MRCLKAICLLLFFFCDIAFSQIGTRSVNVFDEEVRENMRARAAADQKREKMAAQTIARDRQKMEEAKRSYAEERELERRRIQSLPDDATDKVAQQDFFVCMFPDTATSPRGANAVDECVRERLLERGAAQRQAILEEQEKARVALEKEQLRLAEEKRLADEAAEMVAQKVKQAKEEQMGLIRASIGALGLLGLLVVAWRRREKGVANIALALLAGCFSGVVLYFMAGLMFLPRGGDFAPIFVVTTLVSGAILSMYLLLAGQVSLSGVLKRSFVLGASEWLAMIPVGIIFAGKTVSDAISNGTGSTAEMAGASIGGGLLAFITSGFSIGMVVFCLIGYLVTFLATRETRDIQGKKRCPECAEYIQAEARKCRFCGAAFNE